MDFMSSKRAFQLLLALTFGLRLKGPLPIFCEIDLAQKTSRVVEVKDSFIVHGWFHEG